jgi:hypothetical protein
MKEEQMRSTRMMAGSLVAAMTSLGATPPSEADSRSMREHQAMVEKVAVGFVALAGSDENAMALVESLRAGAAVKLFYAGAAPDDAPREVVIDPPTDPMEWHDVRMALMLARDGLMGFGVLRPSGEQLHAVLLGGEVAVPGGRVIGFRGVLCMRAEGFHWGKIASERFLRRAISRIE